MAKILIVDDDSKLLRMLERTLRLEGFQVFSAISAAAAMPILVDNQPDLLILDWSMPEMDGITLLRQIREDKNTLPVLMLTAPAACTRWKRCALNKPSRAKDLMHGGFFRIMA